MQLLDGNESSKIAHGHRRGPQQVVKHESRPTGSEPEIKESERINAIRWAYRLFLDREPESDQAIRSHASLSSYRKIRDHFLDSEEFRSKNASRARESSSFWSSPMSVECGVSASEAAQLRGHVARNWNRLGEEAPHWSVLSTEAFRPERIRENEDSFYASGARDLELITSALERNCMPVGQFTTAFEFGCGLGRVTTHLARKFHKVIACDISHSHLAVAQDRVRALALDNVDLVRADSDSFGMKETFDLWFSRIVLQHNPPPIIQLILERMFACLNPGGVAIFQVPTYATHYRFVLAPYLKRASTITGVEMHAIPQSGVFEIAAAQRAVPIEVLQDNSVGVPGWISTQFLFRKL